ncbi:RNA-binding protein 5-like isoform X2 [Paramacrobiotus metropolitanus]|uniref:RNA-binding protein 5-like isoform X2 n=1 Tax=Paramacrobiotus metropolitanus TaxID=2943436 RepID=UPI002445B912|nr:RNA-binding protein 5-like isoform X2 [Paramacrobiotus metropolitanus]
MHWIRRSQLLWMSACHALWKGAIYINNQRVIVHYCEDRDISQKRDDRGPPARGPKPPVAAQTDWECLRCGCNNFRHRMSCFRCEAPRSEAEHVTIPSADDQVGLTPCSTLLLRNLDPATEDNKILQSLSTVLPVSGIKTVKIMRDPRTQQSVGYGFVQFRGLQDCTEMYNCLMRINPPLTIDGKQVAVSFAKQSLNEILSPQPLNQPGHVTAGISRPAHSGAPGNDANSAAAVAQLALQQMQKTQMSAAIVQQHMHSQQTPAGIPAGYQFDAASGYYFDPTSQLYFDPTTQYYWNPQTQQFLMWNAQTQSYVAVVAATQPVSASVATTTEPASKPAEFVEEKPKPETEKEKEARRIVQEMEKWARSQNQKVLPQKKPAPVVDVRIGEVASVFKEADDEEAVSDEESKVQKVVMPGTATSSSLTHGQRSASIESEEKASISSDPHSPNPDSPPTVDNGASLSRLQAAEEKLIDWERFACLLCKRQLPSREVLQKHLDTSELHLKNLIEHRKKTMTEEEIEELEAHERNLKYRDRAKERRQKYGETEPAPPLRGATAAAAASSRKRAAPSESEAVDEEPAKARLGSDNVGAKLMKAMGWSEGKGLGKAKQGKVDPVEAKLHSGTTGLGVEEGAPDILPTDTYASKVRKTMRNRFRQMQE